MSSRFNVLKVLFFSINHTEHQHNTLVWFHDVGLSGANSIGNFHWKMKTFGRILQDNGHADVSKITFQCNIGYKYTQNSKQTRDVNACWLTLATL